MNKNLKILLLGAQGNLGSEIYKELKTNSFFQVIPWSRKTGNLTQKRILEEKIVEISPNIIINTVAYNNVDACEKELQEQQKAIELNINLVANLTEVTKKLMPHLSIFQRIMSFLVKNHAIKQTSPLYNFSHLKHKKTQTSPIVL